MTHDEAMRAMTTLVKNENLQRHCLAAGACMKELALYLKQHQKGTFNLFGLGSKDEIDPDSWETVGLLHDADYERTKERPMEHTVIVVDEVRSLGLALSPAEISAIKFHNHENTNEKESLMGWGIYCVDELTGLIVACTLVRPEKKLAVVTPEFVLQKYKEPAFAKGALRDRIAQCEPKLGIKLEEFTSICLHAMQNIASDLSL